MQGIERGFRADAQFDSSVTNGGAFATILNGPPLQGNLRVCPVVCTVNELSLYELDALAWTTFLPRNPHCDSGRNRR